MDRSCNFVIIVAAGAGLRMESKIRKQYLDLNGIPVLTRTIMAFDKCDHIREIILVVPKHDIEYCKKHIIDPYEFVKKIHLVKGGQERQDSVLNGLELVDSRKNFEKETIVMIHDGVRPFIDGIIIKDCIDKALEYGACIPAIKVTDTVKEINLDLSIEKTIKREFLYCAQTPQTFKLSLILQAFAHAEKTFFSGTDDASIVEHSGHKVYITKGSRLNIKITTQDDLVFGKYMLNQI